MAAGDTTASDVAASPASDVLLVVGNGTFIAVDLRDRDVVIGRDPACDVVLDHRSLSRYHAVLHPAPVLTVEDLDSRNGTRVGATVRRGAPPVPLAAGETFVIGPFSCIVVRRTTREQSASNGESLVVDDPTPAGIGEIVREVARSRVNVLIVGETGVGKEVLAGTIHELSGRNGPYVRVNCAALSEGLLESELFGHEKGSFTGAMASKAGLLEAASRGTVFLDEIGELSTAVQAKLLRAVEEHEVLRVGSTRPTAIDVRFIAATNRDLMAEVERGTFRRDLFFRLDGVQLGIRPLRDRPAAIARLATHFVDAARADRPGLRLSGDALAALQRHDFPGNVRELKAVIDRAALLARGGEIQPRHLQFAASAPSSLAARAGARDLAVDEQIDRDRILRMLDECAGNQTRAAKELGISRSALLIKLRVYRIRRPRS